MNDNRDLAKETEIYEEGYDEPRYLLDEDSICYGCQYYKGEENGEDICETPEPCMGGHMNGYRMDD